MVYFDRFILSILMFSVWGVTSIAILCLDFGLFESYHLFPDMIISAAFGTFYARIHYYFMDTL